MRALLFSSAECQTLDGQSLDSKQSAHGTNSGGLGNSTTPLIVGPFHQQANVSSRIEIVSSIQNSFLYYVFEDTTLDLFRTILLFVFGQLYEQIDFEPRKTA